MPALSQSSDTPSDLRINLREDRDVAYWTQTLAVSEEHLRRTVADVGDRIEDVCDRIPH